LERFLDLYNEEELSSYVELILGLPEETLDSFIEGVCKTMELGQHNYIGIYSLTALPNTPFGDPSYIEEYGLEVLNTYTAFNHYDITEQNEFEREDMIVASNTMTFNEYKKAHVFRWAVMFGHYLGTVQYISRFLRNTRGISYRRFYEDLLQYMYGNPDTFIGQELRKTVKNLDAVLNVEQPWGRIIDDVRESFAWDFEEATAIQCAKNREQFYSEIRAFLEEKLDIQFTEEIQELFKYQKLALIDPESSYPFEEVFNYNIHDVIFRKEKLRNKQSKMNFDANNYDGDYYKWGVERLWWGRRVGACKTKVTYVR
jgi:putative methyltransferase